MSQQSHQPSLLNRIARVLLCLVFIHAVIGKLTGFAGVAGAIAAKGLPLAPVLLVAAMALMAVGSALVISCWKARLGAVLLLVFLMPTTLLFHGDVADRMERIQLFKNLAIMGGLLLAWMNRQSLLATFDSGQVHYWSRSRQQLWHKGATSGHLQLLRGFR